jgi:hypothetical protein
VSCPYFYPTESRDTSALLPLGDLWQGQCFSEPDSPASPLDPVCCNLGYARGQCARFPQAPGPDAVRFTILQDEGACVRIYYVQERDHHPFAHGAMECTADAGFGPAGVEPLLQRQASAYVASYRRRKGGA